MCSAWEIGSIAMDVKQNKSSILFPELKEGVVVIVPQTKHISYFRLLTTISSIYRQDYKQWLCTVYHRTNFCEMFSLKTVPKQYISTK